METSDHKITSHQNVLRTCLLERQIKNPNYSLRSLARCIGISPALLSQLMSGQRRLTPKSAEKIAAAMDLSTAQSKAIRLQVEKSSGPSSKKTKTDINELSGDQFLVISDWYHYGILGLAALEENKSDPPWIAKKLSISVSTAKAAFARLIKLGFIECQAKGFRQAVAPLDTTNYVPSTAIRKYHRQNLDKAADSLVNDPFGTRFFSGLTVAIDPDELPALKAFVLKFKKRFDSKCSMHRKRRVYQLGIQFFPLDKEEST
ncbi:MAG: TIGR02147 family protein [Proteobacteria bacterium]|nr:TIGR02147 family protein [Pseudomonadota bacterium]